VLVGVDESRADDAARRIESLVARGRLAIADRLDAAVPHRDPAAGQLAPPGVHRHDMAGVDEEAQGSSG